MAKGSVRKKGKKWYYRFYVEDASGNLVQKEFAGTENKSETEKLLRQAMEDYEAKRFVAKAENITLGELLDLWAEEELKTGTLSNGTVGNYLQTIGRIKQHPISKRKLTGSSLKSFSSVVNGFRFFYFTAGPFSDFFRRGQTNLDRIKCNWLIPFVCLILWHLRYSLPSILHRNPLLIRQQIPAPPQKVLLQHLQVPRSQHRTPAL